jgi:hypothetical protein
MGSPKYLTLSDVMTYFEPDLKRTKKMVKKERKKEGPWCAVGPCVLV